MNNNGNATLVGGRREGVGGVLPPYAGGPGHSAWEFFLKTVAARRGGSGGGNCPGRQRERAPKEGGCSQGRGDKYDICPRAPETLAPPLGSEMNEAFDKRSYQFTSGTRPKLSSPWQRT
jgi:hypothetical protein